MEKYDKPKSTCTICGSSDIYRFHAASSGEVIFKCRRCRTQFMNPPFSDEYLAHYYGGYIRDESDKEAAMIKSDNYNLSLIEQVLPGTGRLLDIGSGNGLLLNTAKKRGWFPVGHEIDPESAKRVGEAIGMEILSGEITNYKPTEPFDAVTMIHVLEHLKEPLGHIKYIHSILKDNGILFIAMPNIQSRSGLFKLALEKLKIRRVEVAMYYDTDHHLWYFTPYTIRNFLEANGFEVIRTYSGDIKKVERSRTINYLSEKITSKLFWHSSMGIVARKK